jgi:hypothetical protein
MQQNGQDTAVVLGAIGGALGTLSSATGQAWLNHFWSTFRASMTSTVTCTGGVYRDVSQADGVTFDLAAPPSPAGGNVGAQAVAAASMLIRWRTESGGRSARGRTYLPGVPANIVDLDYRSIKAADLVPLQTAADAYTAGFSSGGIADLEPAILSFTKGAAYAVVRGNPVSVLGIQRRRMRA